MAEHNKYEAKQADTSIDGHADDLALNFIGFPKANPLCQSDGMRSAETA
jgi:hypothetical protein